MTQIPDKHFVFVAGAHRTGTSSVHAALRAHPDISGFKETGKPEDEGQHLQSLFPTARQFGGPGRFAFDPASFMDETHPLATPENAAKLCSDWRKHGDLNKEHLLEKSPPTIVRTRFFQALFPRTSFVVIRCHPIAVAYATLKWCPASIFFLVEHTLRYYEPFYEDKQRLKNLFVLRYEDFVERPNEMLRRLPAFVGVAEHSSPLDIDPTSNHKYFARCQQDLDSLWMQRFTMARAYADVFEHRMSVFGYGLDAIENVSLVDWINSGSYDGR
jgi:hypothetical protein